MVLGAALSATLLEALATMVAAIAAALSIMARPSPVRE
jgi:hypothetical protein